MLAEALTLAGPSIIRFPKTQAPWAEPGTTGSGLAARRVRAGDGTVCLLAIGKMVAAASEAAELLAREGIDVTVWDPRVVSHPDPDMVADACRHDVVVTAEDGIRQGGAGMFLADAIRAEGPLGTAPPVVNLGIPRAYLAQGRPDQILARHGLDATGLASAVRDALYGMSPQLRDDLPADPAPLLPPPTVEQTLD
jgi:1-deoxy-D-xylulose-5-phosphate synthase